MSLYCQIRQLRQTFQFRQVKFKQQAGYKTDFKYNNYDPKILIHFNNYNYITACLYYIEERWRVQQNS